MKHCRATQRCEFGGRSTFASHPVQDTLTEGATEGATEPIEVKAHMMHKAFLNKTTDYTCTVNTHLSSDFNGPQRVSDRKLGTYIACPNASHRYNGHLRVIPLALLQALDRKFRAMRFVRCHGPILERVDPLLIRQLRRRKTHRNQKKRMAQQFSKLSRKITVSREKVEATKMGRETWALAGTPESPSAHWNRGPK